MKFPVAWICCFLMLVFAIWTLYNAGFSDEDLVKQTSLAKAMAINECNNHRMASAGIYPKGFNTWVALCATESPFKIYEFQIEVT